MARGTRPGRPNAATYVTTWGETIDGAYKGKDGKLRPIGSSRPAFSLNDEARAVHRFRRWEAKQGVQPDPEVPVAIEAPTRKQQLDLAVNLPGAILEPRPSKIFPYHADLVTSLESIRGQERNRLRTLILTDPKQAAIDLDIAYLAWYPANPVQPQFTLRELGAKYLAEARNKQGDPLAKKHVSNSRLMWNDFCDTVEVAYGRDLTKDIIHNYANAEQQRKMSAAYVRNRFVKVKAILNWGIKKTDDETDLRQAWDLCDKVLDLPEVESNPQPIEPADFHALLDRADVRLKAMLLLGLNAAMHSGEIVALRLSDLELDKQTLSTRRGKNRHPRVAWLWRRTVRAIRKYQSKYPHHSEYVFVAATRLAMSSETLRQSFVRLRKRSGVSSTVTMEGLRDAAYTVAEEEDAHHAKFVAGHKTGMSDKYVLRQAMNRRVIACCEAIERHFFGKKNRS